MKTNKTIRARAMIPLREVEKNTLRIRKKTRNCNKILPLPEFIFGSKKKTVTIPRRLTKE
jgi:hypothetical protein